MANVSLRGVLPLCAILCILTVVFAGGCAGSPDKIGEVLADDIRVETVEWARLAQSAHNYQPWQVRLDPLFRDRMRLFIEPDRLLPETDPRGRQTMVSLGHFLAVVEARAAQLGYRAAIDLFPKGGESLCDFSRVPVALITFTRLGQVHSERAVAADIDALTTATVKYRYRPAALGPELVERITSYAGSVESGLRVDVVTDPDKVAWLNRLSIEAFTIEMEHEATLIETYESVRWNGRERRRHPYGLAFTANFPHRSLWMIDALMTIRSQRPEAFGRSGVRMFTRALEEINTYIILATEDNSRRSQVEAGMVLQAMWMDLHATGHVALAISQPLQEYAEVADLYAEVHHRLAPDGETLQLFLAVARPRGGQHLFSPRFSASDIIIRS
ncbi:hypothetical protein SAMN05920897_103129 [Alkalispirochaeta americana]|uniref:Nitroreductase family protein n=1 Tax=Alkalispirochaeta americana TaxID=159291 RepID=A0A1N6PTF6_9SPIO|nr:hypothetical protein [Alkalispirochaeta americana]SIQ07606.1 hypothetical protein SAMN05920897_103129 [Alkalispirochaeta americana]